MRRGALPELDSKALMAVVAVARYRSFMAAAASLGLSQPAVTRQIKRVESELGIPLFVRTTRRVTVTDAGMEFASLAQRLLNDLKIGVAHVRSTSGELNGQVIVSSVFSLADAVLPSLTALFGERFPNIELHLREGLQSSVQDEVRSGLADFGIGYIEEAGETFATEALSTDGFFVVAPRSHGVIKQKSMTLQTISAYQLVSFPPESSTRRIVDQVAADAGVKLKHVMTTNRLATLQSLVRNNVGLAVVPERERPDENDPRLASRRLIGRGLVRKVGIIRLRERELSPAAERFLEIVRRWARLLAGRNKAR